MRNFQLLCTGICLMIPALVYIAMIAVTELDYQIRYDRESFFKNLIILLFIMGLVMVFHDFLRSSFPEVESLTTTMEK